MFKKGLGQGLGLGLVLILFFAYAFAEESFTITTYYPSPYGSYNQLEVHRGVTYKPLASTPNTDLREGELVYVDSNPSDSTPGQFYYYGGGTWVAQGGGGSPFAIYCGWTSIGTPPAVGACTPPACPGGYLTTGVGCAVSGVGGGGTSTYVYIVAGGWCSRTCYK